MNGLFSRAVGDRRGATAIEYGLIAALIVVATMAGIRAVGLDVSRLWQTNADRISTAVG